MTRYRVPRPLGPLDRPALGQHQALSTAERLPTLDPHRRLLFAQRLAMLIQRLRAATTIVPREDVAHES
jgi:hypothetical protein